MARRESFGTCLRCGTRKSKAGMVAHLKKCLAVPVKDKEPKEPQRLLVLRVTGESLYWLDVVVEPQSKLKRLDSLLRRTWLECCGHLSEFYVGRGETVGMGQSCERAFESRGGRLNYVYDFGSSTELQIQLNAVIEGYAEQAVEVVARNEPVVWTCDECGQPATCVCQECSWSGDGFYCDEHGDTHGCGEEMLLPVVNSPRMGVCGYTG